MLSHDLPGNFTVLRLFDRRLTGAGIKCGFATLLCVLFLLSSAGVFADIYKYRDTTGAITLSDKRLKGDYKLLKVFKFKSFRKRPKRVNRQALSQRMKVVEPLVATVARETKLAPELLHAVILAESAYDPKAVSPKGAVGLMQLMPKTAKRYGVSDRRDPAQNVRGGARYLRDLLAMFDQDMELALAAYNAGENAVIKYGRQIPPYAETQKYVGKVIAFFNKNRGGDKVARN